MSFDDLYNNFKIVEQEVKRTVTSSSNSNSQHVAFVSTPSSTNDVNTASVPISTASTTVSTASHNCANLSDATVYAFLANQPNGSHLVHEDLEQIHEDDLEAMDLKWQLALLSMRARKYYQRTGNKITINGSDVAGYDKSKVECFNCHKIGHFPRECRGPRNQENMTRNQESINWNQEGSKRTVSVEDTSTKAMIAFDGAGFDWSFIADEELPTNMALMAFSDSEVQNNKSCSNSCLKNYETLKSQYDNLRIELNKSEFDLATYKRGLASVEEQLVFYKKNEIKLNSFENASKSFDEMLGSQIANKSKNGVGFDNYNVVAPPPTGLFAPPPIDLSDSGLKEFQQPEFEGNGVKANESVIKISSNETKKNLDAPIIEEWVSDSEEDESEFREIENVQPNPKQADEPKKISDKPRNNSTNWNKPMSKKLGVGFQFTSKACFVCGSFNHLIKDCDFHDKRMIQKPGLNNVKRGTGQREAKPVWNNALRTNHQNFSNTRRNFAPTAVLTKSGIVPFNTVSSSRTAVSVSTARPINTAAPKTFGDLHVTLKDTIIFDSGCSRHMTGNKSYLGDYRDYGGGFVAFAGSSKGGKITGRGKIRTGNLDFEDVYFVKELKFNLFSVSQMCDKKNSILFIETECLILSPDFKLSDENQVMLKIPRKDNMYSFDLKNIVPSKGLTCLFAKATNDESKMWHRRLGHINFKTMNKLVKGNLVRGLPSKLFENDHTCVACQK
ncbi:ribonuclease H-like domain-containing protein [Tanacetum coccineum]